MKFTKEQIEKVSALRMELVERVNAFEYGLEYGKRIFMDASKNNIIPSWPTWIRELSDNVNELELEEMKIGDIDVSKLDEADFYVCLGRYFERIYSTVEIANENTFPYFNTMINVYTRRIMQALKK